MFRILKARYKQGYRTSGYPEEAGPPLPERFRGRPIIDPSKCPQDCRVCAEACPTNALKVCKKISIDLGKCLFCTDCSDACPEQILTYSKDHRLSVRKRSDLVVENDQVLKLAESLSGRLQQLFGRSLKLRQVSAGGCNACEADTNVLNTPVWDLARFGIQFVASPRHADGLLITGPVTENMKLALQKTYSATPDPKIVIAVGSCAISGGPYIDHPEANNGVDSLLPVDLYIPGCPPHPLTILDGLLRLIDQLFEK